MQTSKVRPEPKIPDHEVLRKIGGGAYGEVWLARGVTGALRAVKTVWHNDFEDERGFEREFEGILKYEPISRDHPGLVHVLHVGRGETDGEPFYYYVMELGDDIGTGREINEVEYEARTLRSDMKAAEGRALDVEECISAGRILAEALDHLHQHGLAHRDVKPSNVIFVDGKAKLADIGLVALRGQQTFVGTEGFVPPEGPGSAQADVYSLGKVLYEMATGKDRLDFPELPDELPEGSKLRRWRALNSAICDVCEPKISRRRIKTAGELAVELSYLEAGRRPPVRVSPGLVMAVLITAVGVGGGAQLINWRPLEVISVDNAPPVEMGFVTVLSTPDEAEVIDDEGKNLGATPTESIEFPVGSIVGFTLVKRGYRDTRLDGEVTKDGLVLVGELELYRPPEPGTDWTDVFDTVYQPEEDHHVSRYYVSGEAWKRYQGERNLKSGEIVALTENGMSNEVVLATEGEAKRYARWLERQCRPGYLDDEHWIEPRLDRVRPLPDVEPDLLRRGMRPFYCVVRRQHKASIYIGSEPSGADIFIDGEFAGVTTPRGIKVEVNLGKGPKSVELIIEKPPKYKRFSQELQLRPNEHFDEDEAIIAQLELEDIFSDQLVNSLGMTLVPVRGAPELLASIWETRVRDYDAYLHALKNKLPVPPKTKDGQETPERLYALLVNSLRERVKPPPEVSFIKAQGPDHPIVNVTRKDAERFCRWLTLKERREKELEKIYEYRLPTDAEWSTIAGLLEGFGWPQELHGRVGGFFWGGRMPPPLRAGNFSDQSAECFPEEKIAGYNDQFPFTSPVGQFNPREVGRFSLYDLEGNVMEWVSDDYNAGGAFDVARGASWRGHLEDHLKMSVRRPVPKTADPASEPFEIYGFRVVLAKVPVNTEKEVEEESQK